MLKVVAYRSCRRLAFAVVTCSALCAANARAANLVVNGDFETGGFAPWTLMQSAPNVAWTADNSNFITTQVQGGGTGAHLGAYSVQFGGLESYAPLSDPSNTLTDPLGDKIVQNIPTIPGDTYLLSYWVNENNNTPGQLYASWNGSNVNTLSWPPLSSSSTWTNYTSTVVATSSSTPLQFSAWGFNWWTSLDNVSVTFLVPEPSSVALLSLAAVGLAFAARRRKAERTIAAN